LVLSGPHTTTTYFETERVPKCPFLTLSGHRVATEQHRPEICGIAGDLRNFHRLVSAQISFVTDYRLEEVVSVAEI
jgi:hypothetical protein